MTTWSSHSQSIKSTEIVYRPSFIVSSVRGAPLDRQRERVPFRRVVGAELGRHVAAGERDGRGRGGGRAAHRVAALGVIGPRRRARAGRIAPPAPRLQDHPAGAAGAALALRFARPQPRPDQAVRAQERREPGPERAAAGAQVRRRGEQAAHRGRGRAAPPAHGQPRAARRAAAPQAHRLAPPHAGAARARPQPAHAEGPQRGPPGLRAAPAPLTRLAGPRRVITDHIYVVPTL